ncbi:unnamed protein product [Rotaria sordida]|uniref:Uncharacterized protein n=2 Tax=Rotaria sordida TaxID=392033 RepID=A0A814IAW8_9BILA|nr:unnamed protein product [Rotaria sordida]
MAQQEEAMKIRKMMQAVQEIIDEENVQLEQHIQEKKNLLQENENLKKEKLILAENVKHIHEEKKNLEGEAKQLKEEKKNLEDEAKQSKEENKNKSLAMEQKILILENEIKKSKRNYILKFLPLMIDVPLCLYGFYRK